MGRWGIVDWAGRRAGWGRTGRLCPANSARAPRQAAAPRSYRTWKAISYASNSESALSSSAKLMLRICEHGASLMPLTGIGAAGGRGWVGSPGRSGGRQFGQRASAGSPPPPRAKCSLAIWPPGWRRPTSNSKPGWMSRGGGMAGAVQRRSESGTAKLPLVQVKVGSWDRT